MNLIPRGLKNSIEEVAKWADTRGMMGFENADQYECYPETTVSTSATRKVINLMTLNWLFLGGEAYLVENSEYVMNDDELQRYFITAISQHATYERILEHKDHTIFVHDRVYYAFPHGIGTLQWR